MSTDPLLPLTVWIHRDSWRDVLTPESKHEFVTALAKGLWKSGLDTSHYADLATHVKSELAHYIETPQHFLEVDSEVSFTIPIAFAAAQPRGLVQQGLSALSPLLCSPDR